MGGVGWGGGDAIGAGHGMRHQLPFCLHMGERREGRRAAVESSLVPPWGAVTAAPPACTTQVTASRHQPVGQLVGTSTSHANAWW